MPKLKYFQIGQTYRLFSSGRNDFYIFYLSYYIDVIGTVMCFNYHLIAWQIILDCHFKF